MDTKYYDEAIEKFVKLLTDPGLKVLARSNLSFECKEIYRALKPELGLKYKTEEVVCPAPGFQLNNPRTVIREIIDKLKYLRARARLLEEQTPGQGEGKGIKKFFRNHWQWLIGAIIGFIGMIFGILQFLVIKK